MKKKLAKHVRKIPGAVLAVLFIIAMGIVFFAGLLLVFPYLNPFPSLDPRAAGTIAMEKSDADETILLNNEIAAEYGETIYPQGKERICDEVAKVRQIPGTDAKLDEIFEWEMKDWIEPDDNISAFACANVACSYIYLISDPTRMKASPYYDSILYPQVNPNGTYYADDPYWIAYNKVGECREYSELFDFMAQQSGIDSRIVSTDAHQWVEIELPNGSYYYDPWCAHTRDYYNATDVNMTFEDKWFNKIGEYEENCQPPDPYFITYRGFPYVWATPKYWAAYQWQELGTAFNVMLPGNRPALY
jgi:hypothetical protein